LRTRWPAALGVTFVAAWAIRSLIVTGGIVVAEDYKTALTTEPRRTQAIAGDPFAQSLLKIDRRLPRQDRVVVIWDNPDLPAGYAFFWATYWLFPRPVTVTVDRESAFLGQFDSLIDVRPPDHAGLNAPDSYAVDSADTYPRLTITTYRRR
jgi:hypothetical protein